MKKAEVVILKTSPSTVLDDYSKLLHLAEYQKYISEKQDTLIKLNLSWTKYFPSCSSQPWQLEGVVKTLLADGYEKEKLLAIENKTVVTNPRKGARNNRWKSVLEKYDLSFIALPEVEWTTIYPEKFQ